MISLYKNNNDYDIKMSREDEYYQGLLENKDKEIEELEKKISDLYEIMERYENYFGQISGILKNLDGKEIFNK